MLRGGVVKRGAGSVQVRGLVKRAEERHQRAYCVYPFPNISPTQASTGINITLTVQLFLSV